MKEGLDTTRYYPMLVSENGEGEMSLDENRQVWERFDHIPAENQDILTAHELPERLQALQEGFGLSDRVTAFCSLLVRKFFFGDISQKECEERIRMMLAIGETSSEEIGRVIATFREQLLEFHPAPKPLPEPETEDESEAPPAPVTGITVLPLLPALAKLERLGNQLITRDKIRVKSQPEPVRPSIFNWLKYYRDELGIGFHDSVQRGDFLFRSENGRRLSEPERERINLLLKSMEEELPLQIDSERQEILFPRFVASAPAPRAPVPQPVPVKQPLHPVSAVRIPKPPASKPPVPPPPAMPPVPPAVRPQPEPAFRPPVVTRSQEKPPTPPTPNVLSQGDMGVAHAPQPPLPAAPKPAGRLTFSFNHVLPAEQEAMQKMRGDNGPAPVVQQPRPQASSQSSASLPLPAVEEAEGGLRVFRPQPGGSGSSPFHIRPVSLSKDRMPSQLPSS